MTAEDPKHPRPDEIPEHERTGNEPNPSGQPPKRREDPPASRGETA